MGFKTAGGLIANLGSGVSVSVQSLNGLQLIVAGFGEINITLVDDLIETDLDYIPEWGLSQRRFVAVLTAELPTHEKIEIYRYFAGWELFFYFESPYQGRGFSEILLDRV